MSFLKPTVIILLLGNLFLYSHGAGSINVKSAGYRSITRYGDGFIAAGSGGKIDWISLTGKITKSQTFPGEEFNCILTDDNLIIAAGDKGIIRISNDGNKFQKIESGQNRDINSITFFNGSLLAGADQGIIISGVPGKVFKETKLNLKGNIVSVSSRSTDCYGVTDEGEIIHTRDGISWDIIDFNKVYSGYYKSCYFSKVIVTENRIAAVGIQIDGSPVAMFSSQGNVWTERPLYYTDDQGKKMYLENSPNDVIYDEPSDQFFLACNKGELMQLPSCSQCNKLILIQEEDIEGISISENIMMTVGKNFAIKGINVR
jgi:hypothetical protein